MAKSLMNEFQPSITEWFAAIGEEASANAFREEDNRKTERLEILHKIINLPYEQLDKFPAEDLINRTSAFQEILNKRGNELCAIRLVPKKEGLPKLRNRGLSVRTCYETWFLKQQINPQDYDAYICPHTTELLWSMIFVVNEEMIFGEIVRGMHYQLTHGDTQQIPCRFQYNWRTWRWSAIDQEAQQTCRQIIELIRVMDETKQERIRQHLRGNFTNNYLMGYFEATIWPGDKIHYIDYNRVLPRYIPTPPLMHDNQKETGIIQGIATYPGIVRGRVVVIDPEVINRVDFPEGAILVCENTDTRFIPLIKKAGAVVTDKGGILSHAAIITRELKKPGIVGTDKALEQLQSGDMVEVDANKGIIKKL